MSEISHYGVLGMKWGVRRTPEQLGHIDRAKRKISKAKAARDIAVTSANKNRSKMLTPAQKKLDKKANRADKLYRKIYEKETRKAAYKTDLHKKISKKIVEDPEIKRIDSLMSKETDYLRLLELDEKRMKREGEIWTKEIVAVFGDRR